MQVDVLFLPSQAKPDSFRHKAVAVFDILRATTTMTAALAAGVPEIRLFPSIEAVEAAQSAPGVMRCGERNCLRPDGFDLGNSPVEMMRDWCGAQTLLMSTTNGTRAVIAAREARVLVVGALVNASAVARKLAGTALNVTLLCAGTNGEVAMEDVIGAGAVIAAMGDQARPATDQARIARGLFEASRGRLAETLADSAGGRNVIAAGLERDIEFAARLDRYDVVGRVDGSALRVSL